MQELAPDVLRWTAFNEGIGAEVSSLFVAGEAATLIDPMLPEGGIEEIARLGTPQAIVLTNRHHLRHSERLVEAFACPILCHEAGLHEFAGGGRRSRAFASATRCGLASRRSSSTRSAPRRRPSPSPRAGACSPSPTRSSATAGGSASYRTIC